MPLEPDKHNAHTHTRTFSPAPIPIRAGVGLKPQYYREIIETRPDIGWFEVHPENYMCDGGPPHHYLSRIRQDYPLSLHGVGLSLGGDDPLSQSHLERLKRLIDRYQPGQFSEHLAWSTHDDIFFNDLLPLPYTEETLKRVCEHIDHAQTFLKTRLLLENPSTYIRFAHSDIPETEFLDEIAKRTGCGLLLDVNNVWVSATNHDFDPHAYIEAFPVEHVGEIHLAGHTADRGDAGETVLIDSHNRPVADAVWSLFTQALERCGPTPALIERDSDLPPWPELLAEAARAEQAIKAAAARQCQDA